jgi:hypothetical protein
MEDALPFELGLATILKGSIGHKLPQEAPQAFAKAVVDVDGYDEH